MTELQVCFRSPYALHLIAKGLAMCPFSWSFFVRLTVLPLQGFEVTHFFSKFRWRSEQGCQMLFSERELTFTFAICCRPSVCRMSSVCRLSVTLVHPTQAVVIFGNISTAFGTLVIHWHSRKILRRSSHWNPSAGGVKHYRGSQV